MSLEHFSPVRVVTKTTRRSVQETVTRLVDIVTIKDMRLFAMIDLAQEAQMVGVEIPQTVLVMFGEARLGAQVMAAAPLAALDLPLKVLVWSDGGQTVVSYESPRSLASRHHLQPNLATKLDVLNSVTDALVASV